MGKKFIPILFAIAAVFCTTPMRGDNPPENSQEILIKHADRHDLIRTLSEIQAFYLDGFKSILTTVSSDIGMIEVTVTNLLTGEVWSDTFDSRETSQHLIPISGSLGYYEVHYITEYGDVYAGEFIIE